MIYCWQSKSYKKNSDSYCAVIWRYPASQFWLRVFLQRMSYAFSVLIQWLQVGFNASLEIRTLQPSEQLECYQMATTQENCFNIQKNFCFTFMNSLRYQLSIQQKYVFKNISQSVSCTGDWVGLLSIFELYATK